MSRPAKACVSFGLTPSNVPLEGVSPNEICPSRRVPVQAAPLSQELTVPRQRGVVLRARPRLAPQSGACGATGALISPCFFHPPHRRPPLVAKTSRAFSAWFWARAGGGGYPGLGQVWFTPRGPLLAKGVFLRLDDLNHGCHGWHGWVGGMNTNPPCMGFPSVSSAAPMRGALHPLHRYSC
jgi:hypothetical protein